MSYLTKKATKGFGGKIAGSAACLILAAAAVSVAADYAAQGDWGLMAVDLALLILSLWPVARTVRHIIRRRRALALAAAFEQEKDTIVTVSRIERALPMPGLKSKMRDLLHADYLRDVYLDWEKDEIILTSPHLAVAGNAVVSVKCPHCGGPNQLIRGRVNRCCFCGSTLIPEAKKP